ncbi:hypothetical protein [Cupriavidus campinensis]
MDKSLLALFGPPIKTDRKYPQVVRLSIIRVSNTPQVIMREIYGGGIYDVRFSLSQRFVSVESRFVVDVLDIKRKTSTAFEPSHEIKFQAQECSAIENK